MTEDITTTENVFEANAREMVCIPGFCGYADCMQAGMTDEEASGHTDDCNRLTFDIAKALKAEREEEREECAKLLTQRAEYHRAELDLAIGDTTKTVRDMLQAELFELATAIRSRS